MARTRILPAALAVALTVLSAPLAAQRMSDAAADRAVQTQYDQMRDESTVLILSGMPLAGTSRIAETTTWYTYPGKAAPHGDSITIGLSMNVFHRDRAASASWQMLENREVIFLVDDSVRLTVAEAQHDGDVHADADDLTFKESLAFGVPLDVFRRIANANTLQVRIGPVDSRPIHAGEIQLQAWRALLRRLDAPAPAPAP